MKKLYLFLSLFTLCCYSVSAQITVVPGATAAALAAKLTGPGVTVMAPTLTCASDANGIFTGTSTLGFDSGIILTSGSSTATANPASFFASTANGTAGDAELTALAGQPTDDACVLEFDFRPTGDTIKFNYVFGSEEYNGYTCTEFNDVFGFFISGPGFASPTNLALVPGTSIPVCINSVNCGPSFGGSLSACTALGAGSPFCAYYINNIGGTTIAYDGLTTTLTAIASVTPCDTYHLKIGIADANDEVYDSGVFLEAGSLTSNSFTTTPVGINPTDTGFGAQYCVRGCVPGLFVFHNTGSLADTLTIHYIIAGTAINGTDYTTIADSAVIPAHDSTDTVFIHGLPVSPASGPKTVKLLILAPYTCGGAAVIIDSVELTIYDSFYVHINTADTAICLGQSVHINASGAPSLIYWWNPAGSLDNDSLLTPTITPTVTTTYTVSAVYPGAGCAPSTAHITITVYQEPLLNVGAAIKNTCVGVPLQLDVTTSPSGTYGYSWTPATYLDNYAIANPTVTPGAAGNTEYYVTVSTPVPGCSSIDSFMLHVLPNDFTLVNQDTGICFPPSTYQIFASGDTEFSYQWSPSTGVSNPNIIDPTISPAATTTYTLTASYPGCPDMSHTILYSIEHPQVDISITDTTVCIVNPVPIPLIITPADSPYTFTWTPTDGLTDPTVINPSFFSLIPGTYTYYLTIQSGLGCTSTDSVTFHPAPPIHIGVDPAVATIPYGQSIQLNAINLSPNPLYFYWVPDNGTLNNPNINNPISTPQDSIVYTVYGINEWGCKDSAFVTINVDLSTDDCIPSAFTPNNDGLNDVFRMCNMHNIKLVDFRVMNRWGQTIYQNTSGDGTKGWDGTFNGEKQDMGTYNYMIIVAHPDGTQKIYKGDVTLIR